MIFVKVYYVITNYAGLLLFGGFGLMLNLFCLLVGWVRQGPRAERFFQRLIHWHFALFVWWAGVMRVLRVRYHGFERLAPDGQVLVANHPGLMDIVYLLARIPAALCIFKPAIRQNPLFGASARCAGYLGSDRGHDVVRDAAEKVAAGHTLVIFPEGTRTKPGETLGGLRPGFVLIARRAQRPIQLVRIECSTPVLVKGQPWWKPSLLPCDIDVRLGPRVAVPAEADAVQVTAAIEAWYRHGVEPAGACAGPGGAVPSPAIAAASP